MKRRNRSKPDAQKHLAPEPVQPQDSTEARKKGETMSRGPDVPPSLAEVDNRQSRNQDTTPTWKKILEIFALLVVVAYTFFAGAQWLALLDSTQVSRDAITNTNKNFVKDQRPYIWITPQKPEFALHQPAWWNIQYSNYGRSPALDVKLCTHLGYGATILSVIKPVPIAECFKEPGSTNSTSIVPPGWIGYTTAGDGTILNQRDINAITNYNGGLAVVGVFEYKDREGNSYSSTFCNFRFRTGALGSCDKYNEIK